MQSFDVDLAVEVDGLDQAARVTGIRLHTA